jgi:hypothetical protein
MPIIAISRQHRGVNCCAVCEGKFGLIRHYSWRTALCSKKCVARFQARRADDRRWLHAFGIA